MNTTMGAGAGSGNLQIYDPGAVALIGTHLEPMSARNKGKVKVYSDLTELLELECEPRRICGPDCEPKKTDPTMALIYGYIFEGHTYQMSQPRIMVVGPECRPYVAGSGGNGVDPQPTGDLFEWRMNRGEKTVSIAVESGTVETLILEANTPGNSSIKSYASHMQTAHRGGRLT